MITKDELQKLFDDWSLADQLSGEIKTALLNAKDEIARLSAEVERLKAECDKLQEQLDDIATAHRQVMEERCPTDEIHCTCVPILKAEIAAKDAEIAALVKALDEATYEEDYFGNVERDYRSLSDASSALCERLFKEMK